MKKLKLKKIHYRNLPELMRDCGVVKGSSADPSRVFAHPKDLDKMRIAIAAQYRKEHKYCSKRHVEFCVSYEMLNLSPVEDKNVNPGYVNIVNKDGK